MAPITTEVHIVTTATEQTEVLSTHIKVPMTSAMREAFKEACYIDRTNMAEVLRKYIVKFNKKERSL